jgi:multidrug resistance protein, MATE family
MNGIEGPRKLETIELLEEEEKKMGDSAAPPALINIEAEEQPASFFEIFKNISLLSWAIAISYTFSFEVFLTTIMLTYLSSDDDQELAATTLIATMMNSLIVLGASPLFGLSVMASQEIGKLELLEKEDNENKQLIKSKRQYIAAINRKGIYISAAITPGIIASLFYSEFILVNVFFQDEKTSQLAQEFLRPYSLAVPAIMSRICSEQMMFSFGSKHAKSAMLLGLVSLAIGTGIGVILGFGELGSHKYKARGIAAGYVLEALMTALFFGVYLARHKDFKKFNFFHLNEKIEQSNLQFKTLGGICAPISLSVASELTMALSLGTMAGWVGTREQAALSSAMQCVFFSFIPIAAFGQVCMQEVSRKIGAEKYEEASKIGKYGMLITLGYNSILPFICAVEPRILTIGVTVHRENTLQLLKLLMPIISTGITADIVRYNILQQLRALGDSKVSSGISVACLTSGIAISAGLGLKTDLGLYGVATGYTTGILVATAILLARWNNKIKPQNIRQSRNPDRAKVAVEGAMEVELPTFNNGQTFFKAKDAKDIMPAATRKSEHHPIFEQEYRAFNQNI